MGLLGKLEDLARPDIFSLLSLSKKTGRLILSRKGERAVVVFSGGQVVQAASSSLRESLGHLLVLQKAITADELKVSLELQRRLPQKKRLGALLVEKGFISPETLENTVKRQIEDIIFEVLEWKEGLFNFELGETNIGDDIGVNPQEFLLRQGIKAEYLIMEGARLSDERVRDNLIKTDASPADTPAVETFSEMLNDAEAKVSENNLPASSELTALRSMFTELRLHSLNGEITLLIMRYASETVDRGVLLMVKSDYICGLGQFGIEANGISADQQVRNINIPLKEPSIFSWSVDRTQSFKGNMSRNPWNDYLVRAIGGQYPKEILVIPMVVDKKVAALIYGDNLLSGRPIKNEESLEIFIHQASLAMEKTLLERRLLELQKR